MKGRTASFRPLAGAAAIEEFRDTNTQLGGFLGVAQRPHERRSPGHRLGEGAMKPPVLTVDDARDRRMPTSVRMAGGSPARSACQTSFASLLRSAQATPMVNVVRAIVTALKTVVAGQDHL